MKKLTIEEARKQFKNVGLILLSKNVNSNKDKLTAKDYDGYYYYINTNNIKKFTHNIKSKVIKTNPYSLQNVNLYLKQNNIEQNAIGICWEDITKIKFKCNCGKEYYVRWNNIVRGRNIVFCCEECKHKIVSKKKFDYSYVKDTLGKHGYTLLSNEYKGNNDNLLCLNKDGYKVYVKFSKINNEYDTEPYVFSIKFNSKNYIYNINNYFKINDIDCKALYYVDDNRFKNEVSICCQCSCGNEFFTTFSSIKYGKTRCSICSKKMSNIEQKIEKWLKSKNIQYELQKKFNDCKDIRELPFDFYLKDYNCCIEVDGRQHSEPIKFSYLCTEEEVTKNFESNKKHDDIKTEYCKQNGIKLIRIPQKYIERRHEEYKKILYDNLIKK